MHEHMHPDTIAGVAADRASATTVPSASNHAAFISSPRPRRIGRSAVGYGLR
jgi:hypothetical protein